MRLRSFTLEVMAQLHFDLTWSSATLRKTYKNNSMALEGITTLGLASYSEFEKHPKYTAVLEYMGANAKKLAGQ